ncbi:MAG TPA: hydrogenase 4 subunit B [Clostridiaceae bacterium]
MIFLETNSLFVEAIIIYIIAGIISLVIKRQKVSNITANVLCILASCILFISALTHILIDKDKAFIELFKTSIPYMDINFTIDNLSAFFLMALSILVVSVSLYSIEYLSHYYNKRNLGLFNMLYSFFILSMIFVFTAGNGLFFLIAWELMSTLSYFLVVFEAETEENQKAGLLYIIMTHIGTAFIIAALMLMFTYTKSFNLIGTSNAIPINIKSIMFVFFLIGFGMKAGIVPLHIWLPYAHPAAPSNVSALMSGIMIKTAIYGILRFVFQYLGVEKTWWGVTILVIGIITTVIGVAYAFVENNIKRLLAYSSIENVGIIFIGLGLTFIGFSTKNMIVGSIALTGALFHSFNHTLFKGSLFLGAGSIHYSTGSKNMEELGGLIKKMPITAVFVLFGSLAISALIPFNGFIGEWFMYQGFFSNIALGQSLFNILSIIAVAALAIAGALAAGAFIKFFGICFLGIPRSEKASNAKEVPLLMSIGTGILASLCLFIGLFPMLLLKVIDKVTVSLNGQSLIGKFRGNLIIFYPIKVASSSIAPLTILISIILVISMCLIIIRIIGGRYIERKNGTWDCGFDALNSRMEYSAAGFSKPIKIVFKILFRPSRELKVEGDKYNPQSMEYEIKEEYIFEKYIYDPILRFVKTLSRKIKFSVQTGSIHLYLLYIFITVLILMLYNRLS